MHGMATDNFTRLRVAALVTAFAIAGCAASPPTVNSKLDPLTAVTFTFSNTPFIFYRNAPSRAAFARSYLDMGPIEANRAGTFTYYLWFGTWNTSQTRAATDVRDELESILLFADGEPLSLSVSGWTPATIGASEPVYAKPFASSQDAYYQVTIDQIRLLAEAQDLRLQTTGSSPQEFELWDEQISARNDLQEFLDRIF